jgi:hypothetical protein
MNNRNWNWRLWAGFGISVAALVGYVGLVLLSEDTPQVRPPLLFLGIVLVVCAVFFLISGLQRAFGQPESYRGKIAGPILSVLSLAVITLFGFFAVTLSKALPSAANTPKVGQRAPEFTLVDVSGHQVSLSELLATPMKDSSGTMRAPKGVLLVFYRGYW